ncbi:universal stress protein [Haloarcula sp. Atlit-7R]|uniref:universal stress protein n=1 Tax=Haloarcula sp. Atlit-7R TaxID=2282125 RepID=UPI0011C3B661|nr:universal stress protein [Haloarcula sp. Atlit-7R]
MTYNRVLVLIGDEAVAARNAEVGIALAERLDAAVHLLRVVETQSSRLSLGSDAPTVATKQAVPPEVEKLITEAAVDGRIHTAEGPRQEQVLRYATEQDIDLVLIRPQASTRAFDSLVDGVGRAADIPILAVPDDKTQIQFEQLVVPNLETVPSEAATEHAVAVAEAHGTTVRVVTVIDLQRAAGPFNAGGVSEEFIERKERELRSPVEAVGDPGGDLTFETLTALSRPEETLDEYVADAGADALVVGHDKTPPLVGRLRPTGVTRIRQTVDVPVLVVP